MESQVGLADGSNKGVGSLHSPDLPFPTISASESEKVAALACDTPQKYERRRVVSGNIRFAVYTPSGASIPSQGWKLHISASIHDYGKLVRIALPLLKERNAHFKVVADLAGVMHLNGGLGGISQIGKIVTVYCRSDGEARNLASELSSACQKIRGPRIPSDCPVLPGSVVHYRYGAFDSRWMVSSDGLPVPALMDGQGNLVEDVRATCFTLPAWVQPLFALPQQELEDSFLARGYVTIGELSANHKGRLHVVFHTGNQEGFVLKQAFRNSFPYADLTSSLDLLRAERLALEALSSCAATPDVIEYWEDQDEGFLVQPLIGGLDIQARMKRHQLQTGRAGLDWATVKLFAERFSTIVQEIHSLGWVHRDIKPANVLVDADDETRIWLIDWETATPTGAPRICASTRGYRNFTGPSNPTACPSEDWHALGRLLIYMLTGRDLSLLADEAVSPTFLLESYCPSLNEEALTALAHLLDGRDWRTAQRPTAIAREKAEHINLDCLPRVRQSVFETICAQVETNALGHAEWRSGQPYLHGLPSNYLNVGTAGVTRYLTYRHAAEADHETRRLLCAAIAKLTAVAPVQPSSRSGLMMGLDGVWFSLHGATTILGVEPPMLDWSTLPLSLKSEYFDGLAGQFHAALLACGPAPADRMLQFEPLFDAAADPERHVLSMLDGKLGFAHGIAGIGFALAEFARVSGNMAAAERATRIGQFLLESGASVDGCPDQAIWPASLGENGYSHGWCHGTVGFGKFFLSLWLATGLPEFRAAAESAGRTVANQSGVCDSTLCHGLSGAIDLLLDLEATATGVDECRSWHFMANQLSKQLLLQSTVRGGYLVFVSETPEIISPDYMVGMAGVGAVLERLDRTELPSCLPMIDLNCSIIPRN